MYHSATMGWFIDAIWCINTLVNLAGIGLDHHVHGILAFLCLPLYLNQQWLALNWTEENIYIKVEPKHS